MRRIFALLAAAAAFAPPALAQDGADGEEIVVLGREQEEKIRDFVTTLTPARVGGQLGRFHYPVCPAATGLPGAQNQAVVDRIRQVAAASGIRVAGEKCAPNLFVVVADDKAAEIARIRKEFPGLVAGLQEDRLKALATAEGGAAAWHVVDEISADGTELSRDSDGVKYLSSSQDPSRLRKATVPHFLASVVVVEWRALGGLSTRQLADYAAMRALAPIDPLSYRHKMLGSAGAPPPAPSILTLLDGAPADSPQSVTWWDFAFLQALYASSNVNLANLQRADMQAHMARTLSKVPEGER